MGLLTIPFSNLFISYKHLWSRLKRIVNDWGRHVFSFVLRLMEYTLDYVQVSTPQWTGKLCVSNKKVYDFNCHNGECVHASMTLCKPSTIHTVIHLILQLKPTTHNDTKNEFPQMRDCILFHYNNTPYITSPTGHANMVLTITLF